MSQDNPSPEIKRAIHAGARWFEQSRITGIRQTQRNGDKVIVHDREAPPLWPRFSVIVTNRRVFCGRDGVIKHDIASIEAERRNGYAWHGGWGSDVASRYSRWKARWDPEFAGTTGSRSRMRGERRPLEVRIEDQSLGEPLGLTLARSSPRTCGWPFWPGLWLRTKRAKQNE
jgi:hypothetical protein